MQESKEIKALLHLIDDPDEEVFITVSDRIISYGQRYYSQPGISLGKSLPDSIQERIEMLIHRLHYRDLTEDFQRLENQQLSRSAHREPAGLKISIP